MNSILSNRFIHLFTLSLFIVIIGFIQLHFKFIETDESLYYWETMVISNTFHFNDWFGSYDVGSHGFLFKIPVAILFNIFGYSLNIPIYFNILLAVSTCFLLYKFFQQTLKNSLLAFLSSFLILSSYSLLPHYGLYYRDLPLLFSCVLLFIAIFKNSNSILIGFIFLLILDAKEYFFFVSFPVYCAWILLEKISIVKNKKYATYLFQTVKNIAIALLPSLIYLLLMFTTQVIPMNMGLVRALNLNASTKTFIQRLPISANKISSKPSIDKHHKSTVKKQIYLSDSLNVQKSIKEVRDNKSNQVIHYLSAFVNKLFYHKMFSLQSFPFVIIVFAFWYSLRNVSLINKKLLFYKILFYLFTFSYLLLFNYYRYYIPVLPIVILFFSLLIFSDNVKKYNFKILISISIVLTLIQLIFFEQQNIFPKLLIHSIVLLLLISFSFQNIYKDKNKRILIYSIFVIFYSLVSITSSFYISYTSASIKRYSYFGENCEYKKIASYFDTNSKYWFNGNKALIKYFHQNKLTSRSVRYHNFTILKDWIPRDRKPYNPSNVISYPNPQLESLARINKIDKIAFLEFSKPELIINPSDVNFIDCRVNLKTLIQPIPSWWKLEKKVYLKNKILYIFDVNFDRQN